MPKHKTISTFYLTAREIKAVKEIFPVHVILQKKKKYQKFCKNCNLKTSPGPFSITRLCLIPKLLSKMCFVFYARAFDCTMTFEYLKR